ncbi:Uncharacterised protein [Weeksella virosa]|uniref:Uncharacterized protein n=1 Tax=Weeksella virosa (strain ATCC 43766 / DSM 16922 / JCM 21250 / CCUG 30538 / CDC 9751 / IAM 14551 / NBRC 16016 / NCTC 11634 / CL345/78) TaxID=865938 RepID=F0NX93_WEEVC|nr:hypothetical protein Weevi_0141 [Weeksella virosa DSM 16922]VEH63409.1 Uncharacterised protein [Weeksella virosa]
MYSFKFSVTIGSIAFPINNQELQRNYLFLEKIASTYDLQISQDYCVLGYNELFQENFEGLTVSLSRQVKKYRSVHNLLKILEASCSFFQEDVYHIDYFVEIIEN